MIEFCRLRGFDDALAVIDRVYCDAVNHSAAKSIAVVLTASRIMPQTPDLVRVLDEEGTEFFREALEAPPEPSLFGGLVPVGGHFEK